MEFLLANKSSLILAVAIGLLTFFAMRVWSRRLRSTTGLTRRESSLAPRTREAKSLQPLVDAPPEITRWQVEMHDLARDLKGELDTKIAVLEHLVIEARAEADRLEALVERAAPSDSSSKH
jgi:hypothetical protein